MAKQSGLGDRLFIAGVNLSGDIGSIGNIGGGPAALDVTGIDKSGFERIGGLRDGRLEYSAWFNPATGQAHDVLSTLPTGSQIVTYCRGAAVGSPAAGLIGKQINYDPTRGNDGALSLAVNMQASDGVPVEWGRQGTAGIATATTSTSYATLDGGAASTFGLQMYVHVFAFTGTDAVIKVQSSSDNGAADAFADVTLAVTPTITGVGAHRIATSATLSIERYLQVRITPVTTGFTNVQFAVLVVRNEIARDY